MGNKKYTEIELLKIIACFFIAILHVIENGNGQEVNILQLFIYFLGTYGIPLFFMINGYLLFNREFTYEYIKRKIINIVCFVSIWGISIGILKSVITKGVRCLKYGLAHL